MAKPPQGLTSIGKKIVMAVTGLLLCLYLIGHLGGNLTLLLPGQSFNNYAALLTSLPFLLLIELGIAALFLIHAYEGFVVWRSNKNARPQDYHYQTWARTKSDRSRKTLSSTTMIASGTIVLIFVILHVWHFKFGPHYNVSEGNAVAGNVVVGVGAGGVGALPGAGAHEAAHEVRDLARLVREEFQKPWIVILYVLSMLALGFHLYHAVSASFQSLGADHPRFTRGVLLFGRIFTVVIAGGFAFLPLWVYIPYLLKGGR